MPSITSVREMRSWADRRRGQGRRIALVPTMGALHAGHLALVEEALRQADDVVVSVYVNPVQFGSGEDFEEYPRSIELDLERLSCVDPSITVFMPTDEELFPGGAAENRTWVEVEHLDRHLCGRFREGHFRGVATIVTKLLLACKPHVAVFGLKDAQQFVIIKRLVQDLLLDVRVIGVPTVRGLDGLAHSSRNRYLTPSQRTSASVLSKAVRQAEQSVLEGERSAAVLVASMRAILEQSPEANIQYAEVVDANTLQPIEAIVPGREVLAAVAVFFGDTRLVDGVFVRAPITVRRFSG